MKLRAKRLLGRIYLSSAFSALFLHYELLRPAAAGIGPSWPPLEVKHQAQLFFGGCTCNLRTQPLCCGGITGSPRNSIESPQARSSSRLVRTVLSKDALELIFRWTRRLDVLLGAESSSSTFCHWCSLSVHLDE